MEWVKTRLEKPNKMQQERKGAWDSSSSCHFIHNLFIVVDSEAAKMVAWELCFSMQWSWTSPPCPLVTQHVWEYIQLHPWHCHLVCALVVWMRGRFQQLEKKELEETQPIISKPVRGGRRSIVIRTPGIPVDTNYCLVRGRIGIVGL